ncbi:DUF1648 domain-containing protein [Lederbergia sp. NSJ-179]|uniref:DUF1648 domain-containing protein n=1 Tax=Lederbergia sp. NSJ-179 TaxID=2931402 RepID=UPI001FD550B3|nr:DUF1648 domain-containing protein [Lederbergia sp. NSJ-179]MCJ7841041.1 DUF1648 domain-containing protein [Lederbergia sp. NSJ-179]
MPAHYNAAGVVDRWGSKGKMLIPPIIGIMMWIGMTILERYPHIYNYMVPITKENAPAQFVNARLMINVLKNEICFYSLVSHGKELKLLWMNEMDSAFGSNHFFRLDLWFNGLFRDPLFVLAEKRDSISFLKCLAADFRLSAWKTASSDKKSASALFSPDKQMF